VQAADRAGDLTLHVRVDERSAGFLALGLAKLTRVPAVVVTTSGTAVANLHPAVLEAHHGVVPLVVLSADRPVELRGTGANQTTTQPGMFGGATRWSVDLPAPVGSSEQGAAAEALSWRTAARQAVAAARGSTGEPGPVHLNVQLREPLVPTDHPSWPGPLEAIAPVDGVEAGAAGDEPPAGSSAADPVPAAVDPAPGRTLVVVGDLPEPGQLDRALGWASAHGWPVVAEPFGEHPRTGVVPHGPLLLGASSWLEQHRPDRVVTVGRLTLSRPVAALLRRPDVRVEAVRTHGWIRSTPSVAAVHPLTVLDVRPRDDVADPDRAWARAWAEAGERLAARVGQAAATWPSGRAVAATLLAHLPGGSALFVGSSNAARDVDVAQSADTGRLTVVANRGLAGIDGCLSTATGLALARPGEPTYALLGDLTFLHDANGLLAGPQEPRPDLTVVVVNDDGGGIFTLLEPGEPERADDFERVFGTPTGTDLASLCAAHGVRHQHVDDAAALARAVGARPDGVQVVEVRLDRSAHRGAHGALREAVAAALT
jgi:2-succinyl-5-enolpyruvyl-6-hydroxy-3-cyclohexene-1-carboxylate synthase